MYAMLVMNGTSAGGFNRISPESEINDGLLDVVLIKQMPITNIAPFFLGIITGQHMDNKYVEHFKTDKMHIECGVDLATDVDGEAGGSLPMEVSVLPQRLKICTPVEDMRGLAW
jgi:diacylglycerol kinase family enzyme